MISLRRIAAELCVRWSGAGVSARPVFTLRLGLDYFSLTFWKGRSKFNENGKPAGLFWMFLA